MTAHDLTDEEIDQVAIENAIEDFADELTEDVREIDPHLWSELIDQHTDKPSIEEL